MEINIKIILWITSKLKAVYNIQFSNRLRIGDILIFDCTIQSNDHGTFVDVTYVIDQQLCARKL